MRIFRQTGLTKVRKTLGWLFSGFALWVIGMILVYIFVPQNAQGLAGFRAWDVWGSGITIAVIFLTLLLCVPVLRDKTRVEVNGRHVRAFDKHGHVVAIIPDIAYYIGGYARHTVNGDVSSQSLTLISIYGDQAPIELDAEHLTARVFDEMYAYLKLQGLREPDNTVEVATVEVAPRRAMPALLAR